MHKHMNSLTYMCRARVSIEDIAAPMTTISLIVISAVVIAVIVIEVYVFLGVMRVGCLMCQVRVFSGSFTDVFLEAFELLFDRSSVILRSKACSNAI